MICRSAASFAPRSALVTGATSGIGTAFARTLPASTSVILVGRDEARLQAMADELHGAGREVDTVAADLATEEGRKRTIEAAESGEIDCLINNAGMGSFGRFLDNDAGREMTTLEVNVVALTALCRALMPGMIERAQAGGSRAALLNVASTAAFVPVPQLAVYAASKAFVLSFTEALAAELGRAPIDVLAVCPGATRTAFAGRAGFAGSLPGAQDPAVVAKRALAAVGRRATAFSDLPSELALAPLARLRAQTAALLGLGVDLAGRIQRARA